MERSLILKIFKSCREADAARAELLRAVSHQMR